MQLFKMKFGVALSGFFFFQCVFVSLVVTHTISIRES